MFPATASPVAIPIPMAISGRSVSRFSWFTSAIRCCISIAHATARPGASSQSVGAPKTTRIASPMKLSMVPPYWPITSTMCPRNLLRMSTTCSADNFSVMGVKPRRSVIIAVTSRHSPPIFSDSGFSSSSSATSSATYRPNTCRIKVLLRSRSFFVSRSLL